MDFALSDEQRQLADAIGTWLQRHYTFAHRQGVLHEPGATRAADWQALAELGVLALAAPEQAGGFDGTPADLAVVMEALGPGLILEPVMPNLLAAQVLARTGSHTGLLSQWAEGATRVVCAFGERHSRYDDTQVATRATPTPRGFRLDGAKVVVRGAAQADHLLVTARLQQTGAGDSLALFCVPCDAAGVTLRGYRCVDGPHAADVHLDGVEVDADHRIEATESIEDLLAWHADLGAVLACAEGLGVMQALIQATQDYLATRKQFGVPLLTFQALQHRVVDMAIQLEQSRSLTLLASAAMQDPDTARRQRAVSAAKWRSATALTFVGEQAVHLHGGIGVTDELDVAHHFKRATALALTMGDADHHLARFIRLPGFAPAPALASAHTPAPAPAQAQPA